MRYGDTEKEMCGGEADTTNNRMELKAAIEGLKQLKRPCRVVITTDSKYVQNGITQWLDNWKKKNWRTSSGGPVKNQELWQELENLVNQHQVEWQWVKGHAGHDENERADMLANRGADTCCGK